MSEEKTIKFHYIFKEDYNPVYCNGAYGGVTATGEIIANFYLERMPIPESMTFPINENGLLGEMKEVEPLDLNAKIIRFVSTGVVLSEEGARSIYEWLGKQIDELEKRKGRNNIKNEEGLRDE